MPRCKLKPRPGHAHLVPTAFLAIYLDICVDIPSNMRNNP